MEPNWKEIALYLADCHAANIEIALRKSCSKHERKRIYGIMQKASSYLSGKDIPYRPFVRKIESVITRLTLNADEIARNYPEVAEL